MSENKNSRWYLKVGFILVLTGIMMVILWKGKPKEDLSQQKKEDISKNKSAVFDHFARNRGGSNQKMAQGTIPDKNATGIITKEERASRDLQKNSSLFGKNFNIDEYLERSKERDMEICGKFDLSEEELSQTSTDKLFYHLIRTPMAYLPEKDFTDTRGDIGVRRLLNASRTMQELYNREDLAEGVLKMYQDYDLAPESISDDEMFKNMDQKYREEAAKHDMTRLKIARIGLDIRAADGIMMSSLIFPKLKGYEKQYLEVMYERYEKIIPLEAQYGNGNSIYGGASSRIDYFCLKISENLDKELYDKLNTILNNRGSHTSFFAEVKRYLGK